MHNYVVIHLNIQNHELGCHIPPWIAFVYHILTFVPESSFGQWFKKEHYLFMATF